MTYGKIVHYDEDKNGIIYLRSFGFDASKTNVYCSCSSTPLFHDFTDYAEFVAEFDNKDECMRKGLMPLGISKDNGKVLGYKIHKSDISKLQEGQIVRAFYKNDDRGGEIIVPYDENRLFVDDLDMSTLLKLDANYQEFLNLSAEAISKSFRHDLIASRKSFQNEIAKFGDTVHKILTDEEIDYEVEGMKQKIQILGMEGISGDAKAVYQYHLRGKTKIFENLKTPVMGMFPFLSEADSVMLSQKWRMRLNATNANGFVIFTEDGQVLVPQSEDNKTRS